MPHTFPLVALAGTEKVFTSVGLSQQDRLNFCRLSLRLHSSHGDCTKSVIAIFDSIVITVINDYEYSFVVPIRLSQRSSG